MWPKAGFGNVSEPHSAPRRMSGMFKPRYGNLKMPLAGAASGWSFGQCLTLNGHNAGAPLNELETMINYIWLASQDGVGGCGPNE